MSEKYFECSVCGPIDSDEIGSQMIHRGPAGCGQPVKEIKEAWENASSDEKRSEEKWRAFLWASAVALVFWAAWIFFTKVATTHDLMPWFQGLR